MKVINDFIFLKLDVRSEKYVKKIRRDDGTFVDLILSNTNFLGINKSYSEQKSVYEGVMIGKVVGVNDKSWIKFGDTAIIDSGLDTNDNYIIKDSVVKKEYGVDEKDILICINTVTKYHTHDKWTDGITGRKQLVYKKGELMWGVDEYGNNVHENKLLAIERNGVIIDNNPYVLVIYKEKINTLNTLSGIFYNEKQEKQVWVKGLKTGEEFLTNKDILVKINGKENCYYIMQDDILAKKIINDV